MLINVKNKFVASLPFLARLSMKYVYDRKHMRAKDIRLMEESIVAWNKKIDITEQEHEDLVRIGYFLQGDQDGKFEKRKELFKKHKINWAKFHRLPDWRQVNNA